MEHGLCPRVPKVEVIDSRPCKPVEPTLVEGEGTLSSPTCEKCGSEMVQRRANKEKHLGQMFWACITFPKCRGIVAIRV